MFATGLELRAQAWLAAIFEVTTPPSIQDTILP
jgi:hypothetical protein